MLMSIPNIPFNIYLWLFSPLWGMLILILISYLQYWFCKRFASGFYPMPVMWKRFKRLCLGLIIFAILQETAILPVATIKNFVNSPYMLLWKIDVMLLLICGIILMVLIIIYSISFLACLILIIKNKTGNIQQIP
jgi:hypothetical protein